MTLEKSKVIVFGASEGGKNFIKCQNEYDILAVADNDKKKVGTKLEGFPVILPDSIRDYDYDFVVITSMYVNQIQKQLIEELKIHQGEIKFALKSQLKPSFRPFQDPKTLDFARRVLLDLIENFDEHNIKYFIDWGTLLGIVRDGDFILWDDDIDISIHPSDIQKTISLLKEIISTLGPNKEVEWFGSISYIEKEKPISIDLDFNASELKKFTINIGFIYFENDVAVQLMNHTPKIHYERECFMKYRGRKVRAPYKYEEHLVYTYGDWMTEKRQTSFANNSLTFEEPESLYKKISF